jgi:hypothetical protein
MKGENIDMSEWYYKDRTGQDRKVRLMKNR